MDKEQDALIKKFSELFPSEADAIEKQGEKPFKGIVILPCKGVVPDCWILVLEDENGLRSLVYENQSGRAYIQKGLIRYRSIL